MNIITVVLHLFKLEASVVNWDWLFLSIGTFVSTCDLLFNGPWSPLHSKTILGVGLVLGVLAWFGGGVFESVEEVIDLVDFDFASIVFVKHFEHWLVLLLVKVEVITCHYFNYY